MEESKNKKVPEKNIKILVVVLFIVALISTIGLITCIETIIDNECIQYNSEKDKTDVKTEKKSDNKTSQIVLIDSSKVINSEDKNYTLACQGNAGIWVTVDSTQKNLTFSFTPQQVVEKYNIKWSSDRTNMKSSQITFDKKVVDLFFGGMGQTVTHDTLFILLEDGTVEYIPIVHMFNHIQAEVVSYGKIKGVEDVVKFSLANTTGAVTTLAIKGDGTFYDLWQSLKDSGNY